MTDAIQPISVPNAALSVDDFIPENKAENPADQTYLVEVKREINFDVLDQELRTEFGARFSGIKTGAGTQLIFVGAPAPDEIERINAKLSRHDPSEMLPPKAPATTKLTFNEVAALIDKLPDGDLKLVVKYLLLNTEARTE